MSTIRLGDRLGSRRARFWQFVMDRVPRGPLWHVAFSYWDDAVGCGCWREAGYRRWQGRRR